MLAESFENPDAYLAHSQKVFAEFEGNYPQIEAYYQELSLHFRTTYYDNEAPLFIKMGRLLAIDAQLIMLSELFEGHSMEVLNDLGMSEVEVIEMIKQDKDCFYREITGESRLVEPKHRLIYLSEA